MDRWLKMLDFKREPFPVTIEVVPPRGPDAGPLLSSLESLASLSFYGYSVATNPVARPHMSALALSTLILRRTGKPVVLHCTTRDQNRLSLQGLLWGARAVGIDTVLAATGDLVSLAERSFTSVRDLDVLDLIRLAREAGLQAGVVLDQRPQSNGLAREIQRLKRKVEAGAQFAVTQPVYTAGDAQRLAEAVKPCGIPVLLGILPLRTARHAEFLHARVAGIAVAEEVRRRMLSAPDALSAGLDIARQMLQIARRLFAGACIMPPFGHYEIAFDLLSGS